MLDRVIWLIIGTILGAVAATYLHSRPEDQSSSQPTSMPIEATPSPRNAVSEFARTRQESNPKNSSRDREPDLGLEVSVVVPLSNLPAVYDEVIGRPQPKQLRAADRHAIFLTEPRDEAWASAMESGINNYLADNASSLKFKVEYVECRSEHCEIAGYVPDGYSDDTGDLKNGLKNSGWWQGGVSSASTGREINGIERRVIIFNRNVAWIRGK